MADKPRISIIMAAYNAANHIAPALDSLAQQTFDDWELIVIDDGSTDDTGAVVAAWRARDPRIRSFRMEQNAGPAAARNMGLDAARGDWIAILDSDDRYKPDRLQLLLERAERDDLDVIADNLELFDETKGAIVGLGFSFKGESRALTTQFLVANDGPPRIASLGHLKPFIRRSALEAHKLRYPVESRLGEDFFFLFLVLQKTTRALLVQYAGYIYTLPYNGARGERASGTRTGYGADGLDDLRRSNAALTMQVAQTAFTDQRLLSHLRRRDDRLRDESVWRQARAHAKEQKYLAAAKMLTRVDMAFGWAQLQQIAQRRRGRFTTDLR